MIDRLQLFYPVLCADAYPLKSGQPFAPVVPAPWLVLVCLTCGVSLQAATGPAVEGVMHGEDVGPDLLGLPLGGLRQAFPEGFLHFADALFHSPVVLWVVGRAIERDDPVVGEDPVDGSVVERAPVVAFQEERCAVLAEEILQMRGDGLALDVYKRQGQVGAERRGGVEKHAGLGLAPAGRLAHSRIEAHLDPVDLRDKLKQARVHRVDQGPGNGAAPDVGLVGRDDEQKAGLLERAAAGGDPFVQPELLDRARRERLPIPDDLDVQRSVPVQEDCGPQRHPPQGLAATDSHFVWFTLRSGWETKRCQTTAWKASACGVTRA